MKVAKEEKISAGGRRFSVQRKMAVVARLLRGEPLELVAPREQRQHPEAHRMARSGSGGRSRCSEGA
jgi:hypothetical protein